MAINYEHYKTFYYVGKYRNFTLAAKFLYTSQPNVSRTISLLEHEYGCRLIERSNRGVRLTPEGERLLSHVQPAVEQLKLAEESMAQLTDMQQGTVSIGVSDTALSEIVIPALNRYRELYPLIQVRIASSYCLESVRAVKNSLCDFAVVATPFPEDISLKCTPIMEVSDLMVCGPAFSFLAEKERSLAELNAYPNICVGGDSIYLPFFTKIYASESLIFHPDIFSSTTAQTLLMVRNNLGIGFVPEVCARDALDSGALFAVPLSKPLPKRSICLVEKRNSPLSVAAGVLKNVIFSMSSI